MTDILIKRIKRLPNEMSREIFSFLIPDPEKVEFKKENPSFPHNRYSAKYDVAYLRCCFSFTSSRFEPVHFYFDKKDKYLYCLKRIANKIYYLSRIVKKNGKHRYYITREFVDRIQVSSGDYTYTYGYNSKYIGNDLVKALFEIVYC